MDTYDQYDKQYDTTSSNDQEKPEKTSDTYMTTIKQSAPVLAAAGIGIGLTPLIIGGVVIIAAGYYMYTNKKSLKEGHNKRVDIVKHAPVGPSGQALPEASKSATEAINPVSNVQ